MTEHKPPRRVVAFVGNCQAFSLTTVYQHRIAPLLGEEAIHVPMTPGSLAEDIAAQRAQLLRADVIVEQKFDAPDPIPAEILERPGLRRYRFPYLSGRLYWPYGGVEHVGAPKEKPLGGVLPYPAERGDGWLNRMISEHVPPDEALRRYDAAVAESAARIARMAELHLERQRDRDTACAMNFADFIAANYQRQRLFNTQGHPGLVLSRMLVGAVFEAIGVPGILVREAVASLFTEPFPPTEMPIHPGVAEILGLQFVAPGQRYRFMDEGYFTFREFAIRYMAHAYCEDMLAAKYLLRSGDREVGIPLMQQALQQVPGTSKAWQMLADALMRGNRLDEAEAAIRQGVLVGPPHPDVFALQAEILLQRGEPEAAEQAALAAMELQPEHAGALHAQANLLARAGRHAEAVAVARVVAARQPRDVGALWMHAYHLRLAGLPEQAAPVLRQALEIDPANAGARAALDELALAAAETAPAPFSMPFSMPGSMPGPPTRRYVPISLEELSNHAGLRIDDMPVARRFDNLPKRGVAVPPLAFGETGDGADAYVEVHAAAPAWLLRNVTVHGMCGLVTTSGYAIEETLDPTRLGLLPGAAPDEDGGVVLPEREPLGNIHSAFHLLDFRTDDFAHWLLDLCARFGAEAVRVLTTHEGASRAPIVLLPPLDRFWKWEGVDLVVPDTTARLALLAEGDVFVQRLLYVPGLGGEGWATHPATGPLFDAVRDRIAGPPSAPTGRGRRIFIDRPAAGENDAQLAALAVAAGFARAVPGELPLFHLVRLFAEASHVIGPHGSDFSGTVFCRPGTAVCELRPDAAAPWTWRHLAAVRGLRYGCLEGAPIEPEAFASLLRDERFASS